MHFACPFYIHSSLDSIPATFCECCRYLLSLLLHVVPTIPDRPIWSDVLLEIYLPKCSYGTDTLRLLVIAIQPASVYPQCSTPVAMKSVFNLRWCVCVCLMVSQSGAEDRVNVTHSATRVWPSIGFFFLLYYNSTCFCCWCYFCVLMCFCILFFQMVQFQRNTVTGCMVYLVMKHHVPATGLVGMALPPNNYALAVCSTTRMPTAVIGLKMSMAARSIVSIIPLWPLHFWRGNQLPALLRRLEYLALQCHSEMQWCGNF